MPNTERAISLDLDGVVISRFPIQLKAVIDRHIKRRGSTIFNPPESIPTLSREPKSAPLKLGELISFFLHSRRTVNVDVEDFLDTNHMVDVYGNTGRVGKTPWIRMTWQTLKRGSVDDGIKDIYFKPDGTKTMLSKLEAISQLRHVYGSVTHYDDNPADALPIAAFFPDVKVVIVQDLTTGLLYSREEAARYPNVKRVAALNSKVK